MKEIKNKTSYVNQAQNILKFTRPFLFTLIGFDLYHILIAPNKITKKANQLELILE